MAVAVGQPAPAFTLKDTEMKDRSLQEFKGKKVILAFYPAAFTGVCTKEMCTFRDSLAQLNSANTQVLGISTDTPFANKAFGKENGITFPLLSDVSREVINAYDIVFPDLAGIKGLTVAKRAIFVIDGGGVVRYKWTAPEPKVEPNYAEVMDAAGKA
ncbi:MAG TPA: peroxiredoxin [Dehalococcoidia bacterium]|nr:peroxiredoxin [Dehalococcoidia bacterium]